jgi:hypothetical protein
LSLSKGRLLASVILIVALMLVTLPHVAASPSATIQNTTSSFIDQKSLYFHVVGEVRNTGDVWLSNVKVSATFRDQSGAVTDTVSRYTLLNRLAPGVSSGFDVFETDTLKSGRIANYSLTVEFSEAQPLPTTLQIANTSSSTNSLGYLEVLGQVKNNGDAISEFTKVVATYYGSDGRVVDVDFTYTDPTTVQPHSQQPFKLTLQSYPRSLLVKSMALDTQSIQYASIPIPETTLPMLMLTVTLTLVAFGVRRRNIR